MDSLKKDLEGAYSFLQLLMLLLIFPAILYWIWVWVFEYNIWQKLFSLAWILIVCYYFNLIPGYPPY